MDFLEAPLSVPLWGPYGFPLAPRWISYGRPLGIYQSPLNAVEKSRSPRTAIDRSGTLTPAFNIQA